MIRIALVFSLVLAAGCLQSHDGQVELKGDDCYTCHKPDYEATVAPNLNGHQNAGFPTSCVDCHRTSGWQPALGMHPKVVDTAQDFGIDSGPHAGIKCQQCHDLDSPYPSTDGGNTMCVSCHPDSSDQRSSHVGAVGTLASGAVVNYADVAYASPNFCLSCHPNGLAGKHPDNKFPRTGHHNTPCDHCHDRSTPAPFNTNLGGKNVNCMMSGCHNRSQMDSRHTNDDPGPARYNASKAKTNFTLNNFCLDCHPSGRGGG